MYKNENRAYKSVFELIKKKILAYIMAARLSGWLLSSVFFLLGTWYSIGRFPLFLSIIALLGLGGIFSAGFMINNVFDIKLDLFAKKPFVKPFKYISPKEMLFTSSILFAIGLIILWYINIQVFTLGLFIVILGILYSTPPIRLKTVPPFDSILNALGALPFFIGWMIIGSPLTTESLIFVLILGLAHLSYHLLYTTLDIESDKDLGIETSCTKLGLDWSIIVGNIIFLITLGLALYFHGISDIISISFLICLPFVFLTYKVRKNRKLLSNLIGGQIFSLWVLIILFLLSITSRSIISIFLFGIICFIAIINQYSRIQRVKKRKKSGNTYKN